jgi:hypothetical protein
VLSLFLPVFSNIVLSVALRRALATSTRD